MGEGKPADLINEYTELYRAANGKEPPAGEYKNGWYRFHSFGNPVRFAWRKRELLAAMATLRYRISKATS